MRGPAEFAGGPSYFYLCVGLGDFADHLRSGCG